MASLNTSLPVNYDSKTFEEWNDLFPSLQTMIENRVKAIAQKYPGRASDITIRFAGDIEGITSADVESRTACVTANSLIEGRQTLKSRISKFLRKLSRSERHSKPSAQKIQPIIVCTVIMVAPAEASEASDVG